MTAIQRTFKDKFEEIKSALPASPSVGAAEGAGSADASMDNKVEETGPKGEPTKEQRELTVDMLLEQTSAMFLSGLTWPECLACLTRQRVRYS